MIQIRLAKKPDKIAFVQLALERGAGLQDVSSCYGPYRKAIGNSEYWGCKFDRPVKEKQLTLACINGKPVGLLHFMLDFIDYPAAYVGLVFFQS